jgi:hypothetical protein
VDAALLGKFSSRMVVEVEDDSVEGNYRTAEASLTGDSLLVVAEQIGPQLCTASAKVVEGENLCAGGHAFSRLLGRWMCRGRCDCVLTGRACACCGLLFSCGASAWFVEVPPAMRKSLS